jgi:hypothetical protein
MTRRGIRCVNYVAYIKSSLYVTPCSLTSFAGPVEQGFEHLGRLHGDIYRLAQSPRERINVWNMNQGLDHGRTLGGLQPL